MIIAGVIVLALGYLMPVRKKDIDTESMLISEDEIRKMVDRELDNVKTHISDIVDETVTYSMEKTERSMERVANEKIMAVNEYSDTVLEEINKNHKEVIFLYDMLNDKHENLKAAVIDAAQTSEEIRQTLKDAEVTAQGAIEQVESIADEAKEAVKKTMDEMTEIAGMLKEAVYERVSSGGYPAEPAYEDNVYEETDEDFAQDEDFADEEIEEEIFAEEEDFTNERLMDYRESMDFGRSRAAEKMRFDDDEEDYFTPITTCARENTGAQTRRKNGRAKENGIQTRALQRGKIGQECEKEHGTRFPDSKNGRRQVGEYPVCQRKR